jgi:hypothetical protein
MPTPHPLALAVIALTAGACARDPLVEPCPSVAAGELVITEVRGQQSGNSDTLGQWIEVYNTTTRTVPLAGLVVSMRQTTGANEVRIMVRSETTEVGPGGYVTLGRFPSGSEPAYVSYGYLGDYTSNLYPAAALDLEACSVLIDRVIYRSLPSQGSLSYDGAKTPDATGNDDESAWCTDATGAGFPGTPQQRNHPCVH